MASASILPVVMEVVVVLLGRLLEFSIILDTDMILFVLLLLDDDVDVKVVLT